MSRHLATTAVILQYNLACLEPVCVILNCEKCRPSSHTFISHLGVLHDSQSKGRFQLLLEMSGFKRHFQIFDGLRVK